MSKEEFKEFIKKEASKYIPVVGFEANEEELDGSFTKGMRKADFHVKSESPKAETSQPFTDASFNNVMNAMDAEDVSIPKDGAKTYAEAGEELERGSSYGQRKSVFSTKAKNEKEYAKAIAMGIQLPESFKSERELQEFILESAKKIAKMI